MTLKEARKNAHLTQRQAAGLLGVSLRSYIMYETDEAKRGSIKYKYMLQQLEMLSQIDEEHGLLTMEDIRRICGEQLSAYPISYCYLFGSYARGTATENSDVDLLVSGEVKGLRFYGLVDALKNALKKNVDVLTPGQLTQNPELMDNILREGIKVYEKG